jgi:choline kinase
MKVKVRCGRVTGISKSLEAADADGENLGIVKFGRAGAARLVDIMNERLADGGLRDWAPRAFHEFAQVRPLHAIGTRGFPWIEIDFPEDYQRAASIVLPAIEAAEVPSFPAVGDSTRTGRDDADLDDVLPVVAPPADAMRARRFAAGQLR